MGAKIARLSDLDTAFPRSTSERGVLMFDNGYECSINTNQSREEFEDDWVGKTIKLCYYSGTKGAKKAKLVAVRWSL